MNVLVVEDDAAFRRLLSDQLTNRGVTVTTATTLTKALEAVRRHDFDIVILDVELSDGSGLDVLREIRQKGSTAHVIILSGAASEVDRISGFEAGADDYVVKPFFARELIARVMAVRRRRGTAEDSRLRVGHLEIDVTARTVTVAGEPVELTAKEFDLLAFLAARPGHVFSRDELLASVWRSAAGWQQAGTVTEHVRRLRTKIELDPQQPRLLLTVRGTGYRFDCPVEAWRAEEEPAAAPVAGTLVPVDGHIVSADAGAITLTGWEEAELVGRPITALGSVGPALVREGRVAAGMPVRSELGAVQHRNGAEISVEVLSSTAVWKGQPARRVVLTPVTDAAMRLRHLVTGVVTEMADAVVVTDRHFHIRSWNRAAERLYGWAEHEVLGRHMLDIVPWAGDSRELIAAGETLEATGRWHGQMRQLTRDGSEVLVRGTTTFVRDDAGAPTGVVSLNRAVLPATDASGAASSSHGPADIRRALDAGEFEVYYQPLVILDDMSVFAVEALVRWNHPIEGLLGPDAFIQVAEQSGLIVDLGGYVLDSACRAGAAWREAGLDLDVGVNLSAGELADGRFEDRVLSTLESTGMDPGHLWLEVTETALVEEVGKASMVLHRLAHLGVRISIDDFGTGWASLTYLKQFPVHALKIDRSFVEGVALHANGAAIARSIISLGAELGLAVVAEGIDTPEQRHALQSLGCLRGQGYLYGRPTPFAAVPVHRVARVGADRSGAPQAEVAPPGVVRTQPTSLPVASRPESRPPDHLDPDRASDIVASALRSLLRIRSAPAAAELLQQTAEKLGATLALASEAGPDALPIDLSLGGGPLLVAVVSPLSPSRVEIEHILTKLAEDARQAVDLLLQAERLEEETNHDMLTGLANRRVLERVLARARDGAVVMIDLDHFKRINDTLGHAAGDDVLARFGRTLRREVRATDTSCRMGGEEFVVVAAGLDEAAAVDLVDRIRTAWVDDTPHPVTFSAGLAAVSASGGTTALLAADRALYRAKRLGRDRTEIEPSPPSLEAVQ